MTFTNSLDVIAPTKLCITCKHVATSANRDISTFKCFAPRNIIGKHPVDGRTILSNAYCIDQRDMSIIQTGITNLLSPSDHCTIVGNWWEEAPDKPNYTEPNCPPKQPNKTSVLSAD